MKKILAFDCYGTLLDPSPLYGLIGQIAKEQGLSSEKAIHIFQATRIGSCMGNLL